MRFMNKLERKLSKYAVSNLIVYVLIAYGVGYLFALFAPEAYSLLQMDPAAICRGQVWRLFTWICSTPQPLGIFTIFMFVFYYWIGTTLERVWGTFRYNLYMISGWFIVTAGTMLIYLITSLVFGWGYGVNLNASTYYINLASFLAFATLFPNQEVYFMFILRIRMKWLAIFDGILLAYEFLRYMYIGIMLPESSIKCFSLAASIVLSVANFLIFFLLTRDMKRYSPKEVKRRHVYHQEVKRATENVSKHYCAICGRTELTNPELQFRYCSKCNGNYEYCNEHIFTHEHK